MTKKEYYQLMERYQRSSGQLMDYELENIYEE